MVPGTRNRADSRGARAREKVAGALLPHLEVAVGVGEDRRGYLTVLPGGTSAATSRSDGSPASPTVAARTIPLDSTPMSFAGFRFATMTTFFPTSASGSYRFATCIARPTGPVTSRASAKRGDATKCTPKRAISKIALVLAITSKSLALSPVETSRICSERLNGSLDSACLSWALVLACKYQLLARSDCCSGRAVTNHGSRCAYSKTSIAANAASTVESDCVTHHTYGLCRADSGTTPTLVA